MAGKNKTKNQYNESRKARIGEKISSKSVLNTNIGRYLQAMLDGSVLDTGKNKISLPYILLLSLLALLYIGNNYYAQQKIREMNRIEEEMKELRFEYRSINSNLMYESKQSEIARKLKGTGIHETKEPPMKIFANSKNQDD
ncbi:MAG: hypothetical protein K9H84_05205 [Bacteroidales bacterium]|nr:hypothetical protein [Bacteroidales bacterium]